VARHGCGKSPRRLAAASAVAGAIALAALAQADGRDRVLNIEGGDARAARAIEDAQRLVRERFPSHEEIGPLWRRPWEAPRGIPGAIRSEREYWTRVQANPIWAQLYGLSATETEAALRTSVEALLARAKAAGERPPDGFAELLQPEGLLLASCAQLRPFTLAAFEGPAAVAARTDRLAVDAARAVRELEQRYIGERRTLAGDAPGLRALEDRRNAELARTSLDLGRRAVATLYADLHGQGWDLAARALAREAASVRRAADMVYVHGDFGATPTSPLELPPYGSITVELRILARDAIADRAKDLSADEREAMRGVVERLQNDLLAVTRELVVDQVGAQLTELVARSDELARSGGGPALEAVRAEQQRLETIMARAREARSVTVACEPRDLGDGSWILVIEGFPALGTLRPTGYFARLRNGNAVVNLRGVGTYPRAWFVQQLDYFLAAMQDRTGVFRDE